MSCGPSNYRISEAPDSGRLFLRDPRMAATPQDNTAARRRVANAVRIIANCSAMRDKLKVYVEIDVERG